MQSLLRIIASTPLWVWPLLALLLILGVRALRPTTAPLWRLAILPTIFFIWGLHGLLTLHSLTALRLMPWAVALAAGIVAGLMIAGFSKIRADKTRHAVQVPGSALPLVLSLLIFATKYVFGVLHATRPDLFAEAWLWLPELAVSGMLTGMFVGRFAGLWRQYREAPHEALVA